MKYFDRTVQILDEIRNQSGDKYYTMVHGDLTFAIPTGEKMIEFSVLLYEEEEKMKALAQKQVDHFKAFREKWRDMRDCWMDLRSALTTVLMMVHFSARVCLMNILRRI